MTPLEVYTPHKILFVFKPLAWMALIAIPLGLAASLFLYAFDAGLGAALLAQVAVVALITLTYASRSIAYKKTSYEIYNDRFVHKTGSLFSDRTTDLPFRNVTQLGVTQPWIENKFYGTGHIAIHAAGCARGFVSLTSVENSELIYEKLIHGLQRNGFPIRRERMIQREEPHTIGALLDARSAGGSSTDQATGFGPIFGFIALAILLVAIDLSGLMPISEFLGIDSPDGPNTTMIMVGSVFLMGTLTALFVGPMALRFLDLKNRAYTLWSDVVEYEDGFLTRSRKLIPMANLADTHMEETFYKRIFGMADVVLSCQGDTGDIHFPSMPNAATFKYNLEELIEETDIAPTPIMAPTTDGTADKIEPTGNDWAGAAPNAHGFAPPTLGTRGDNTHVYKISLLRGFADSALAAGALLALYIMAIVAVSILGIDVDISDFGGIGMILVLTVMGIGGGTLFSWFTERFAFAPNSVSSTREVITSREAVEFTNDKITSIVIHNNPLDRLLKTGTISFRSIGDAQAIRFRNLPNFSAVETILQKRFGIPTHQPRHRVDPSVSLASVISADLSVLLFLVAAAIGCAIAGVYYPIAFAGVPLLLILLITMVVQSLMAARFSRLECFENYLLIKSGWLFRKFAYVPLHHARNVISVHYPGVPTGRVEIDAGGAGNKFTLNHADAPEQLHDRLDEMLYLNPPRAIDQSPTFDNSELDRWNPQAKNDLLINCGLTAITIVGLPIALIYTNAYYKRAHCVLEKERLLQKRGIFYKTRSSVLFNRIDQVQTSRNALNTIFKNGVVEIFTVGSGRAELSLGPHANYEEIYRRVKSATE